MHIDSLHPTGLPKKNLCGCHWTLISIHQSNLNGIKNELRKHSQHTAFQYETKNCRMTRIGIDERDRWCAKVSHQTALYIFNTWWTRTFNMYVQDIVSCRSSPSRCASYLIDFGLCSFVLFYFQIHLFYYLYLCRHYIRLMCSDRVGGGISRQSGSQ